MKNYRPLLGDTTATQYWVGSGAYDDSCFPGNILIGLIDYDHIKALGVHGPQVASKHDQDFWKNTVIYEYIKPAYEKAVISGMDMLKDFVSQYEPNHEDGTFTMFEHDASDYLPLKKEEVQE